jgi:signal transduction histidine kinase
VKDFDRVVTGAQTVSRRITLPDRVLGMTITPLLNLDGQVAGAVGLFLDITESERLERTRRDYVANVSHELRTPLTAMRALIEPLSEGMVRDEETRAATTPSCSAKRSGSPGSSTTSGAFAAAERPAFLNARPRGWKTPGRPAEKYTAAAAERGLTYECSAGDLPQVLANPDRVEQVLVILLDNAMKYTPEGGRVAVEAEFDDEKVILCVADTGIGIDPADQPYVFDRFYKVDRAHTGLGSGLGLSIASELMKAMGETLWLQSEPGKGSRFYFTLKRA